MPAVLAAQRDRRLAGERAETAVNHAEEDREHRGPVECLQTRSLDAYMVCWRCFSLETLNVEFLQLSR